MLRVIMLTKMLARAELALEQWDETEQDQYCSPTAEIGRNT